MRRKRAIDSVREQTTFLTSRKWVLFFILLGFGFGFAFGEAYTYGKITSITIQLLRDSGIVIDPDLLNKIVETGMRRAGY